MMKINSEILAKLRVYKTPLMEISAIDFEQSEIQLDRED